MKIIKWTAALIAAVMLAFAQPALAANAQTIRTASSEVTEETAAQYARASSRTAYFCTAADMTTSIFAVPYTYCVEVLYEEGDFYRVKYAEDYGIYRAVYGYVLKSDFLILDEAPPTIYLYKSVTVTFSQEDPAGGLPAIGDITVTAAFYGSYYSGASGYSYVLCNGSFGYISGANEDYPIIVTEEEQPEAEESFEEQEQTNQNGTVVAAVIIGIIAVLAVGLVVLSGRRPKKKVRDDNF